MVGPAPLMVTAFQQKSPAGKSVLKPGDRFIKINDQIPKGFIDFNELLVKNPDADDSLLVQRDGENLMLTVRLVPEKSFFNANLVEQLVGLRLEQITPEAAATYGLKPTDGFLVAGVDPNVDGAKELQPGYLITGIDGQNFPDLEGRGQNPVCEKRKAIKSWSMCWWNSGGAASSRCSGATWKSRYDNMTFCWLNPGNSA